MGIIYKIPGPILVLLGGFSLSWGGLIIRSFEAASIWQSPAPSTRNEYLAI